MEAGRAIVNVLGPALSDQLRALGSYYDSIPFELGLAGHCLFIASLFAGVHQDSWLRNLVMSFLGGFGGGSLVNILTGRPPAVFSLDILFLTYFVCWWLYMYCAPVRVAYAMLPVKTTCRALSNWMRAVVICNAVDYSVKTYAPAMVTAPLLLGTIGGCGGKLLVDLGNSVSNNASAPGDLSQPKFPIRSAFFSAMIQLILSHWFKLMPSNESRIIVITLLMNCPADVKAQVAHGIAADMSGSTLDWTEAPGHVFHKFSFIPPAYEEKEEETKQPSKKAVKGESKSESKKKE